MQGVNAVQIQQDAINWRREAPTVPDQIICPLAGLGKSPVTIPRYSCRNRVQLGGVCHATVCDQGDKVRATLGLTAVPKPPPAPKRTAGRKVDTRKKLHYKCTSCGERTRSALHLCKDCQKAMPKHELYALLAKLHEGTECKSSH